MKLLFLLPGYLCTYPRHKVAGIATDLHAEASFLLTNVGLRVASRFSTVTSQASAAMLVVWWHVLCKDWQMCSEVVVLSRISKYPFVSNKCWVRVRKHRQYRHRNLQTWLECRLYCGCMLRDRRGLKA